MPVANLKYRSARQRGGVKLVVRLSVLKTTLFGTIASSALPSLVILLIKSISRYYRDNDYLEALMI
jgi:hypothetical protein